ncbi:hypothetical protein [Microbacterium paraoxydans]|uniref:hypothetical protein n=1 Tax=Microbacterium paraoxydans TaxID=199592 RepID=UPI001CFAFA86|nr:hypothetical protein [Microbacterium paraoxydans]
MASKSKRLKARAKRRRHLPHGDAAAPSDPYVDFVMQSSDTVQSLFAELSAEGDFAANVSTRFADRVSELAAMGSRFTPARIAETARLAYFPLSQAGQVVASPDGGAWQVELLVLLAIAGRSTDEVDVPPAEPNEMSGVVQDAWPILEEITNLGWFRTLVAAGPDAPLGWLSLSVQGSEVAMRNSSYADVSQATAVELLDSNRGVRVALEKGLGFSAAEALSVLNACHSIQARKLNKRGQQFARSLSEPAGAPGDDVASMTKQAVTVLMSMFEPSADDCTVGIDELFAETCLPMERVERVVAFFTLDASGMTALEAAEKFVQGDNPWRRRPLLSGDAGRVMLLHDGHTAPALRERLEDYLKTQKAEWDAYAKHRGEVLEERVLRAVKMILPTATYRNGFEFFVPATEAEKATRSVDAYTKRVECDHLVLIDDVAFVIEDKAVAFSALSRGGKRSRQLGDLRRIITSAANQAGRVRSGIVDDGGLRIEGEGWVDLTHIREIHTIAVSLDDIPAVFTATADLLEAGLIDLENVPWTVSLHDLELIAELVDRPAEFLLYLRRRRDPMTTMMFMAPDELDLFLYFYEAGLWVAPDPALVKDAFPFMPDPTTGELRRFRQQVPAFITSRTDALDQWHLTRDASPRAPKPSMPTTSIVDLIDELHDRQSFGWLSVGATLLSGNEAAQEKFARHAKDLLNNPDPEGRGRSLTVPVTGSVNVEEGWVLVWAVKPAGISLAAWETHIRNYMKAKGHQLNIPRVAAFAYDEVSRELIALYYEGETETLNPSAAASLQRLRPASALQSLLPPAAKNRNRSPRPR